MLECSLYVELKPGPLCLSPKRVQSVAETPFCFLAPGGHTQSPGSSFLVTVPCWRLRVPLEHDTGWPEPLAVLLSSLLWALPGCW